ncbi:MAG TPA: TonB-dependent receptor plug domain-containing protein [Thermoanaerobaculia bacterium]|nr:TonB-dependent receptor plug domain-containing protein [Thermoanaerobaculia bacterium]HUM30871.1 TonB-dependent receptor plug domain-containing protein [Thermoanaerobaculia bacterium]HXK69228.1 TonB-dependent receptor plug domain-containing protein [Thermoanaerobaculia bacterium]
MPTLRKVLPVLLFIASCFLFGDEPSTDAMVEAEFEETITVTAPPILDRSSVDRYGNLVGEVTRKQVEELNAHDVADALRNVPGLVISRYNPVGSYGGADGGTLFIRGHGSGRPGAEIQMMTDGIPRFVGVWTHPLLDTLTLDHVDRIEIYRSSQPVLMGTMGFGAINLVPRRWTDAGPGGRISLSGGSFNTFIGQVEAGGAWGKTDVYLSGGSMKSDGHRDVADGEVEDLYGRFGYRISPALDFTLQISHNDGLASDPGNINLPRTPVTPSFGIVDDFALATLSYTARRGSGSVKLYGDDGSIDWLQWDGASSASFRTLTDYRNYGVRWREALDLGERRELIVGYDYDVYGGISYEDHTNSRTEGIDLDFRSSAPYFMFSQTYGDSTITWIPSFGVRYNDSKYFGAEWGYQVGLSIRRGPSTVYTNYAHAFNLPGVYAAALYGTWGQGDAWKDLNAELLDHVELGYTGSLSQKVDLTVSIYHDEVTDALRFVPPPPPPPSFANIGDYTLDGIEASLHVRPSDTVSLFAGLSWMNPDPADVPNAPEWSFSAGVNWIPARGWTVSLDGQSVSESYVLNPRFATSQVAVDGYTLLHVRTSRAFSFGTPGWIMELHLDGENLTDETYEFRPGYPMPGRSWMAGVTLTF